MGGEQHPVEIRIESKAHIVADAEFLRKECQKYSDPQFSIIVIQPLWNQAVILSVADKGIDINSNEQGFLLSVLECADSQPPDLGRRQRVFDQQSNH
jgi:hypothetical protein